MKEDEMKKSYIVLVMLFLVFVLGSVTHAKTEELSVDKVLKESVTKQLCGEFVTDNGTYEKFLFRDRGYVTVVAMGMEFSYKYFIFGETVYIKTDKAFLEFEIENPDLIHGKDIFTKGHTYRRVKTPEKDCLPMERSELEALVCYTNGIRLQEEGKMEEAAEKYLQCCGSGHAESCNNYGLLKQAVFREMEIALAYYRKACDMGFGGGCSNLATIEKWKGNQKKAKELYQEACDKGFKRGCLEAIELKLESSEVLSNRGRAYLKKGKYEAAIADFSKAIELEPDKPLIYFDRGYAYTRKGEYDLAIADFSRAVELQPNYVEVYRVRAMVYETQGKYESAVADFSKVIELSPGDKEVYSMRGVNYLYWAKFNRAADDFRKALEFNPGDEYMYLYLVNASGRESRDEYLREIDSLRNFVSGSMSNEWIRIISWYYLAKNDITEDEVLKEAQKANSRQTVNERLCEAYYFLAEERLRKGNKAGAIDFFNNSIATGIDYFREYWLSKTMLREIQRNNIEKVNKR
jgi:lipoprotein NlpI